MHRGSSDQGNLPSLALMSPNALWQLRPGHSAFISSGVPEHTADPGTVPSLALDGLEVVVMPDSAPCPAESSGDFQPERLRHL